MGSDLNIEIIGNEIVKAYESFGELSDQEIEGQDYAIKVLSEERSGSCDG